MDKKIKHLFVGPTFGWRNVVYVYNDGNFTVRRMKDSAEYATLLDKWKREIDSNHKAFEYPFFLIKKSLLNMCISLILVLLCGAIIVGITLTGNSVRHLLWPSVVIIFLALLGISISLMLSLLSKNQYLKIEIEEKKILITFLNGKRKSYDIDEIKSCCSDINACNPYIHFTDNMKINRMQKLSYWPLALSKIERMVEKSSKFSRLKTKRGNFVVSYFVRR